MMADYSTLIDQAGQKWNVDPRLISSVIGVESSGNPNAVGPDTKYGNASGLGQFIPATAKALGVSDPTDPKQAIPAIAQLLSQNLDRYQDPAKAIMAYHGGTDQANWGPKTQAYLQKVTAAYQGQPQSAQPQSQGQNMPQQLPGLPPTASDASTAGGDPFSALLAKAGPSSSPAQGTAPAAAGDPFAALMAKAAEPAKAAAQPTSPAQGSAPVTVGNVLGAALEPLATAATGAIAAPVSTIARVGAAALPGVSFDRAKQIGESVRDALTYHPQTAGGQQANADIARVASNALSPIVNSAPVQALTNAYQQNFVQNQSPLMGTINAVIPGATAQIVAPELAGRVNGLVKSIGRADVPAPAPGSVELANRGVGPVPQGLPQAPVGQIPVAPAANDLSAILKTEQPAVAPQPAATIARAPAANDAVGINRAAINDASGGRPDLPQAPSTQIVPASAAANDASKAAPAAAPTAPAEVPKFDDSAPSTVKASLAPDQQQKNLDLMREVGLTETRPSAISGDKFSAGNEYQLAKSDTPQGEVLRAQFDKERTALQNYAQQISQDTGARGASPEEVGQIVRQPLRDLNDYYDNAVSSVYQAADQRAGGIAGIDADSFKSMMDTRSNFAGKSENGALGRGINAYLKEQGIRNADGTFNPMTAKQAEGVRQYINSQWSPQNSGLIGKIKESLDTDVAKSAGDDAYAQARALHAERKNVLDNPKGISSLLNEEGPNGINQAVPDEKIGQKLTSMPVGQLRHIVETLKNVPEPLQPGAQQALAEMKGIFADAVSNAGQGAEWNAAKVTKQLNAQRSRMGLLFDDAEMSRFRTLNDAGHVLQKPTAYPGAAVQGHNLLQKAVILGPAAATAGAMSALFGPLGAAAAGPAGTVLTRKATEFVNRRAANKLAESLSNPRVDWPK
jgi:hypothetical protein